MTAIGARSRQLDPVGAVGSADPVADVVDHPLNSRMTHVLTFRSERIGEGPATLMPCINEVPLADLVTDFERERGYTDPAGGYGGIVPWHFNLGPLASYFLGTAEPIEGDQAGEIYTLFCDCGEAGCWPLIAHVEAGDQFVIWNRFSQPHRPKQDYTGFGPFTFARPEYERAVEIAAAVEGIS